jgi:hypothetical protein
MSDAVSKTITPVNNAMQGLTIISFILILSLGLGLIVEAYYIKRHPILFIVHLFIYIAAIIGSLYIANEYESLMGSGVLSNTLFHFKASSYLILNLPWVTAILGIIGIIIMFISLNRDPEMKSSQV